MSGVGGGGGGGVGGCELRPFGQSAVNVLLSAAGHMQYWRLL